MKIAKKWVTLELEHTTSRKKARRIASDHVREFGSGYYPALIRMENKLKRRVKNG